MKLPKKPGRWILFAVLLTVLYFTLTGDEGLINLYRSHRETKKMKKEIAALNKTIDSLENTIEKLKNDTAFIERIAREKLGMAKKGEKVYKFIEEK
jgi:cell division protein FtsB